MFLVAAKFFEALLDPVEAEALSAGEQADLQKFEQAARDAAGEHSHWWWNVLLEDGEELKSERAICAISGVEADCLPASLMVY